MNIVSSAKLPSERSFGLMLTAVFAFLGVRGIIKHWHGPAYGACFMAAIVCVLITFTIPRVLAPLNKAWFHFGELLGKIVSPIVLGVIFFGILTPIALVTRLFGRDELRLNRGRGDSYWIDRDPLGSAGQSFKNQF
jgi:hypothetical protein